MKSVKEYLDEYPSSMKHLFPILKDLLWIVVCGDREQGLKTIRKCSKEIVFDQKAKIKKRKKLEKSKKKEDIRKHEIKKENINSVLSWIPQNENGERLYMEMLNVWKGV